MTLMRAVERLQKDLEASESAWIEALVAEGGDIGDVRRAQGYIAGLRQAIEELTSLRRRYNEDDDDGSDDATS